jgi:chaperonin GroES
MMRPTYNKIVVEPLPESEVSKGGIILIAVTERQQTLVGIVKAVGPGRITENGTLIPPCVKPGDKILYSRHQGFPIEIDGTKYTVMPDVEAIYIFDEPQTPQS